MTHKVLWPILVAVIWIMLGVTSEAAVPYEDQATSVHAGVDFTQAAPFTRRLAELGYAWAQFERRKAE